MSFDCKKAFIAADDSLANLFIGYILWNPLDSWGEKALNIMLHTVMQANIVKAWEKEIKKRLCFTYTIDTHKPRITFLTYHTSIFSLSLYAMSVNSSKENHTKTHILSPDAEFLSW